MDKTTIHSCLDCKFFIPYYVWRGGKFTQLHFGVCLERNLSKKEAKKLPFPERCEIWEKSEIAEPENEANVKKLLNLIEEHLKQLCYYLDSKAQNHNYVRNT